MKRMIGTALRPIAWRAKVMIGTLLGPPARWMLRLSIWLGNKGTWLINLAWRMRGYDI